LREDWKGKKDPTEEEISLPKFESEDLIIKQKNKTIFAF